ncbi:MAG: hypothetical protein D6731_11025, partial [Planctomycetota bacterium]
MRRAAGLRGRRRHRGGPRPSSALARRVDANDRRPQPEKEQACGDGREVEGQRAQRGSSARRARRPLQAARRGTPFAAPAQGGRTPRAARRAAAPGGGFE